MAGNKSDSEQLPPLEERFDKYFHGLLRTRLLVRLMIGFGSSVVSAPFGLALFAAGNYSEALFGLLPAAVGVYLIMGGRRERSRLLQRRRELLAQAPVACRYELRRVRPTEVGGGPNNPAALLALVTARGEQRVLETEHDVLTLGKALEAASGEGRLVGGIHEDWSLLELANGIVMFTRVDENRAEELTDVWDRAAPKSDLLIR